MSRADVTQTDVLTAIATKLRSELNLTDRTCFVSLEPYPIAIPKGGDYFVTVAPGDGVFVEGEQYPGNCTEEWTIIVTAFSRMMLDSTDHDLKVLQETTRGLLILKAKLLEVLVGADPTSGGNTFVRNLIFAQRAERPAAGQDNILAWISLDFGVHFDWNLT